MGRGSDATGRLWPLQPGCVRACCTMTARLYTSKIPISHRNNGTALEILPFPMNRTVQFPQLASTVLLRTSWLPFLLGEAPFDLLQLQTGNYEQSSRRQVGVSTSLQMTVSKWFLLGSRKGFQLIQNLMWTFTFTNL